MGLCGTSRVRRATFALTFVVLPLLACCLSFPWLSRKNVAPVATPQTVPTVDDYASSLDAECSIDSSCRNAERYGQAFVSYGTSRGYFPEGCRWREVFFLGKKEKSMEYWDAESQSWVVERPTACILQMHDPGQDYEWVVKKDGRGTPASAVEPDKAHTIMRNLWYNNGRWYALVEGEKNFVGNIKMSRNQEIATIHVKNATEWVRNIKHRVVKGDTLIFDFIFFIHPTAIGHWCEMMFPLFSILKRTPNFKRPASNFVLLHLKRSHLMEWVRAVVATTLGVLPGGSLPPVIMQEETDHIFGQLTSPLEGVSADTWVCFENGMVVRDLFTGGKRSFDNWEDARLFRSLIYHNHGLPPPGLPHNLNNNGPPKVITFQRKRANRRVVNEPELLDLLSTYGELNVVEFNASHSFQEQLTTMSKTGVFVSVHTSNLANSPFLPPGSAVVELIQRYWDWNGLDKSFMEQTRSFGDIHHYAWRAYHLNQTVYLSDRDRLKFGNWTDEQCKTEECVEAHTNVDVIVDIAQLKKLLDSRLPMVFRGASVKDAAAIWPPNDPTHRQPWDLPLPTPSLAKRWI